MEAYIVSTRIQFRDKVKVQDDFGFYEYQFIWKPLLEEEVSDVFLSYDDALSYARQQAWEFQSKGLPMRRDYSEEHTGITAYAWGVLGEEGTTFKQKGEFLIHKVAIHL